MPPAGISNFSSSCPLASTIASSQLRASTIDSPCSFSTVRRRVNFTVPSRFDLYSLSSIARWPTPPIWKVRIVSCVPGSPMLWAAMMPTAMPSSTSEPVERSMP